MAATPNKQVPATQEQAKEFNDSSMLTLIRTNNLTSLTEAQQDQYIMSLCKLYDLPIIAKPFDILTDKHGKKSLYINSGATSLLGKAHQLSIELVGDPSIIQLKILDPDTNKLKLVNCAMAKVRVTGGSRFAEDIGVKKCTYDQANDLMAAVTKATHRAIKKWGGLSLPDADDAPIIDVQGTVTETAASAPAGVPQGAKEVVVEVEDPSEEHEDFEAAEAEPPAKLSEAEQITMYSELCAMAKAKGHGLGIVRSILQSDGVLVDLQTKAVTGMTLEKFEKAKKKIEKAVDRTSGGTDGTDNAS